MVSTMNQIESILCDIDGLIGAALDTETMRISRTVEEFGGGSEPVIAENSKSSVSLRRIHDVLGISITNLLFLYFNYGPERCPILQFNF